MQWRKHIVFSRQLLAFCIVFLSTLWVGCTPWPDGFVDSMYSSAGLNLQYSIRNLFERHKGLHMKYTFLFPFLFFFKGYSKNKYSSWSQTGYKTSHSSSKGVLGWNLLRSDDAPPMACPKVDANRRRWWCRWLLILMRHLECLRLFWLVVSNLFGEDSHFD